MTSFLRRPSVVLVIRRSVIALGGGACAAFSAAILANAARPHLEPVAAPADTRPTIIDGPPSDVEAAPPPPRLRRRPAQPFVEGDDDVYEIASGASPFDAAPPAQSPPEPRVPMRPPQPSFRTPPPRMQAARMPSPQMPSPQMRAGPFNPCAGLLSPADRMVCASPPLNAADVALQRLYDMALYRTDNPDALRDEQRRWRAVRDRVAEADGPQALAELYAERIQELDGGAYY